MSECYVQSNMGGRKYVDDLFKLYIIVADIHNFISSYGTLNRYTSATKRLSSDKSRRP